MVYGHIQTGSYTDKDGKKIYTTDVVVEEHEFAENKSGNASNTPANFHYQNNNGQSNREGYGSTHNANNNHYQSDNSYSYGQNPTYPTDTGFMNIPENAGEDMPFI